MLSDWWNTPFPPVPSPWTVRGRDRKKAIACRKWCCKARTRLDIALLVLRIFAFIFSFSFVVIGIWISQMPYESGHTLGEAIALILPGCIVFSLAIIEVCCCAPTMFPVFRPFIITEACFQAVNFTFSTLMAAWFAYTYGNAWFSDSLLIMILLAANALNGLVLVAMDIYVLGHDRAVRRKIRKELPEYAARNAELTQEAAVEAAQGAAAHEAACAAVARGEEP